jgi:hypothetical protein
MDLPLIPDRLEPMGPVANTGRKESPSDSRSRGQEHRHKNGQDSEESDLPSSDDDLHSVDELA